MKKIINVIVVILFVAFTGFCIVEGCSRDEQRDQILLQQQEKDLQAARMARVQVEDIHEVGEN